jgi:hypothetical protein
MWGLSTEKLYILIFICTLCVLSTITFIWSCIKLKDNHPLVAMSGSIMLLTMFMSAICLHLGHWRYVNGF